MSQIGADVAGDLRSLRQIATSATGLRRCKPWPPMGHRRKEPAQTLGHRAGASPKAQRLSNWGGRDPTDKQQLYAATDAWVCIRIYEQLLRTPKNRSAK